MTIGSTPSKDVVVEWRLLLLLLFRMKSQVTEMDEMCLMFEGWVRLPQTHNTLTPNKVSAHVTVAMKRYTT